jgi:hypothetical protein
MIRQYQKISQLQSLLDANKNHFQDDCKLDGGMFRHKTKSGVFCVPCAVGSGLESPMIEEKDGWGWRCPVNVDHCVPGPNYKYPTGNRGSKYVS